MLNQFNGYHLASSSNQYTVKVFLQQDNWADFWQIPPKQIEQDQSQSAFPCHVTLTETSYANFDIFKTRHLPWKGTRCRQKGFSSTFSRKYFYRKYTIQHDISTFFLENNYERVVSNSFPSIHNPCVACYFVTFLVTTVNMAVSATIHVRLQMSIAVSRELYMCKYENYIIF